MEMAVSTKRGANTEVKMFATEKVPLENEKSYEPKRNDSHTNGRGEDA